MNFLFIHQNFPSQFLHLTRYLLSLGGNRVIAVGEEDNLRIKDPIPGLETLTYPKPKPGSPDTSIYVKAFEADVTRGVAVANLLQQVKDTGFTPDLIGVHPAWGEAIFIRDIYPNVPLFLITEFFFRCNKADQGFDPEFPLSYDSKYYFRIKEATQILSLEGADAGISASRWQASTYPLYLQKKIKVIHEGVDTDLMCPQVNGTVTLASTGVEGDYEVTKINQYLTPAGIKLEEEGKNPPSITFSKEDKIVVYMSRNLEPYRGYHVFMRALPTLQQRLPDTKFVIIGATNPGYTPYVPKETFKIRYLNEVRDSLDMSRVFFTGRAPHFACRIFYSISRAHLHLSYPFILSWSAVEAMSCEALVIGSNVESVREAIEHRKNGLLCDFFDKEQLVNLIEEAVNFPEELIPLRKAARETVLKHYNVKDSFREQYEFLMSLANQSQEQVLLRKEFE